jgi:DNA helicase HerA-like ATPase
MADIFLGRQPGGEEVRVPYEALLRHAICLGNAGSGKTVTCKVYCEEFLRQGIPVIAVDPQGDIASLGQVADEAEVVAKGTPAEVRHSYAEKAEVVVWTPGSSLGVPLSVNPVATAFNPAEQGTDLLRERGFAAEALADLANFDLRSAEGRTVTAILSLAMEQAATTGKLLGGLAPLLRFLETMPEELRDRVSSVAEERLVEELVRRLRMLIIGSQSLLLTGGIPLDIDVLLGRGAGPAASAPGKTRLSVLYLNKLATERERQFFVGQVAQALYRWMLRNPQPKPQVLFYIDEIAPYLPPVRKPVCKDALGLLFRQGRKYGVCCLAATQSPGDLDYKALGQISTWTLGRLVVRQDVKKVEGQLKALAPESAEEISRRLPGLVPGQSILFSPDLSRKPIELHTRWLVTRHKTLDEEGIGKATDPALRQRLEQALRKEEKVEGDDAEGSEDSLAGPAVGRAEVAILGILDSGEGTVRSSEILVTRGGTGKVTALGGQTKVTKESIKVAWEAASQLQVELDLPRNFARRYDVTVLDTRLAVKKDGPSAGLAYLTGIVAALRGNPPRPDVAMTGEITILGKVLAVGGIEEKVRAACQAGYATVLIPAENQGDIALLPAELRQAIEVVALATVQEALPVIFASPRRAKPVAAPAPVAREEEVEEKEPASESSPIPKMQVLETQVREFLQREMAAFTSAELADRLGQSASSVGKVLQKLAQEEAVKNVRKGRSSLYFHAAHPLRPEYGLLGSVEAAKLVVLEPDARRRGEGELASSYLVFAREEILSQHLSYLPLYKVRFVASVREGWLFTRQVEKRDNLYFHGVSAELLSYQGRGFTFTANVPANPTEVVDLDDLATFELRPPGDLHLEETEMNHLASEKDIEASALRKFQLAIQEISLVFLPVWRFQVRDKQNSSQRDLLIDGLKGQPMVFDEIKGKGRKKK